MRSNGTLAIGIACDIHLVRSQQIEPTLSSAILQAATHLGLQNFKTLSKYPTFSQRPHILVATKKVKVSAFTRWTDRRFLAQTFLEEPENLVDEDGT